MIHISQLRKFLGVAPPPQELILSQNPGESEYEVEDILDARVNRRKTQFLVKWKGFPIEDASWEPESNMEGWPALLSKQFSRRPGFAGGDVKV